MSLFLVLQKSPKHIFMSVENQTIMVQFHVFEMTGALRVKAIVFKAEDGQNGNGLKL